LVIHRMYPGSIYPGVNVALKDRKIGSI
jgi:hypothetical protein